jgi:hypothetical protein
VLLLERFTARVKLEQRTALAALAAGGEAEIPDLDEEIERFNVALTGASQAPDAPDERAALRSALGLPPR